MVVERVKPGSDGEEDKGQPNDAPVGSSRHARLRPVARLPLLLLDTSNAHSHGLPDLRVIALALLSSSYSARSEWSVCSHMSPDDLARLHLCMKGRLRQESICAV